jgi:hypothetical protein
VCATPLILTVTFFLGSGSIVFPYIAMSPQRSSDLALPGFTVNEYSPQRPSAAGPQPKQQSSFHHTGAKIAWFDKSHHERNSSYPRILSLVEGRALGASAVSHTEA